MAVPLCIWFPVVWWFGFTTFTCNPCRPQKTEYLVCLGTSLGRFTGGWAIYVPFGVIVNLALCGSHEGKMWFATFIAFDMHCCVMVVNPFLVSVNYYLLFLYFFSIFLCSLIYFLFISTCILDGFSYWTEIFVSFRLDAAASLIQFAFCDLSFTFWLTL